VYGVPVAARELRDVAVGFLYHPPSGKVLLQLRDADKPPNAGKWAFFGGRAEPEDGGDLLATWCREAPARGASSRAEYPARRRVLLKACLVMPAASAIAWSVRPATRAA
jgi:hypothetical protein